MPVLIAIPVKDEAERIADCLRALTLQSETQADGVVLVVNNTSDGTAAVARALRPSLPVPVEIIEVQFPAERACAGAARRAAMEHAAGRLGPHGVLMTSDADGRVPPDWIAANLWHLGQGVDAVAGRAVLDPGEAALLPKRLHDDDARECAFAAALDEIASLLDPEPWDPLPRHTEHSGASIAVTVAAYRRAGGMPAVPLAEDRHFFDALRRTGSRIRHAPEIAVAVSGRTIGRAEGGMADTIRRRLHAPDPYLDSALEPALRRVERLRLRHRFRTLSECGQGSAWHLADALGLPPTLVEDACAQTCFGAGWALLESASPALRRTVVPASMVHAELAAARRILESLRAPAGAQLAPPLMT